MIEASMIAEPKFQLQYPASTITKVLVNDSEVSDFTITEDGKFIVLESLDPKAPVEVTIIYTVPEKDTEIKKETE